jgi:hypothetical protein
MYFNNVGALTPGFVNSGLGNQPAGILELDRWRKAGDEALIGRFAAATTPGTIYEMSDAWYSYDASYVRLKNVALRWHLPANLLKKAHLSSVHLYAHAQNLLTFTKYRGLDPETMSLTTLPPLRMITTGIKVEF